MLLFALVAAFAAYSMSSSAFVSRASEPGTDYLEHAAAAVSTLQNQFYNSTSGLYYGLRADSHLTAQFWWNSANCLTGLADLTAVDPSIGYQTLPILANSYVAAQNFNLMQSKATNPSLSPTCHCIWPWKDTCPYGQPEIIIPGGFINDYNDDGLWWALAWIATYDLNHDQQYLDTAVDIFQHIAFEQSNSTCGGVWWNIQHEQQNAITNELFLSVAAHLANRVDNGQYYLNWALRQWRWFEESGLIRPSGLVVDGLNNYTCLVEADGPSYTYNQGVIQGALIELDKANPNDTYIGIAETIARAAIDNLSNSNGILTEFGSNGSPNLGNDGPTFKGVFIRNLQLLAQKTLDPVYANYIRKQADSIWNDDRSPDNGTIGNVWDHYYEQQASPGHCSGVDALVAAAAVSL